MQTLAKRKGRSHGLKGQLKEKRREWNGNETTDE